MSEILIFAAGAFAGGLVVHTGLEPIRAWQRYRRRDHLELALSITALEKSTELTLTYPDLDLPTIKVVRNPNGLPWQQWAALGFKNGFVGDGTFEDGYTFAAVHAETRNGCVKKAREHLLNIARAKLEEPTEVRV